MSRGTLYVFEGDSRRRGGGGDDTCVGKLAQLLLPHSIGRAAPTAVCVTGESGDFAPGPCGHVHELRPDCRGRHVLEERGREGRPTRQADIQTGGESSSESAKWEEDEGDHPANERCYSCGWVGW